MTDSTNSDTLLAETEETQEDTQEKIPAQIPLLDDVVFNTSLPLATPPRRRRPKSPQSESIPQATDLFGGSPETARNGPFSTSYDAYDLTEEKRQVKAKASTVVDSLVKEYSVEIVQRLRDELSSLLDELDDDLSADHDEQP